MDRFQREGDTAKWQQRNGVARVGIEGPAHSFLPLCFFSSENHLFLSLFFGKRSTKKPSSKEPIFWQYDSPPPPIPKYFAINSNSTRGGFTNRQLSRHVELQSRWPDDYQFSILVDFCPTILKKTCLGANNTNKTPLACFASPPHNAMALQRCQCDCQQYLLLLCTWRRGTCSEAQRRATQ
jgi:hypothetical protein